MTDQTIIGERGAGVHVRGVGKVFPGPSQVPLEALKDITVDIGGGEFVAIVGPSGCGKTTLLRMMMGLDQPSHGTIEFDTTAEHLQRSFVFQRPSLLPWRTVEENVAFGLDLRCRRKLFPDPDREQTHVTQLLQLTGLENFRGYYPAQLSGGMQQRVNLARALAVEPNVLLMDEPFSALDALTKERLQRDLAMIVSHLKATVLFVTHDIREAIFLADRIVVMASHPGRITKVMDVDAPPLRDIDFQQSAELAEQARNIWRLLGADSEPQSSTGNSLDKPSETAPAAVEGR